MMELDKADLAKVIINELVPRLKKKNLYISNSPVTSEQLHLLVYLKQQKVITHKTLRETLDLLIK